MRWVQGKIEIRISGIFLAQVMKYRHSAPVRVSIRQWCGPHADGRAGCHFSDEFRQTRPRGQTTERWYGPFVELLWVGVRSRGTVADMAGRFHDVLAHAGRGFIHRNLIPLCSRNFGKLFEIRYD